MIQVQDGRFHFNWKKGSVESDYERFPVVLDDFNRYFSLFCQFVQTMGGGDVRPNQWEVTYVNHIPKGSLWQTPEDWSRVFRVPGPVPSCIGATKLETCAGTWKYELAPRRGRLHVDLQHGKLASDDEREVLIISLTARGQLSVRGMEPMELSQGLLFGRRAIADAFVAITSDEAHSLWGRQP